MEEEDILFPSDSDLDLSFTSTTTDRTFSARSSLTLSFNESRLSSAAPRPHRRLDPHWSAITAAANISSDGTLHLRHLRLIRLLGSGNLGRVFLCTLRDHAGAGGSFALKVVDRDSLTAKKLCHVETEARILSMLDHPFLPALYARIDVSHYTCLLIDYCAAGDLHSLLRRQPRFRFSVQSARFYAAEVLVALEYLHALGIVYRDLKPENVLLREDGHVMLSDFDLCLEAEVVPKLERRRKCMEEEEEVVGEFVAEPTGALSRSCVGTHEYLAPELVSGAGHGNGVDWWAFGVFIYELLYGTTPFKGGSKETTLRNIASSMRLRFPEDSQEEGGMREAKDLIEALLVKDPRRRLGCARGATDVKRHPFFDGIKWPLIRNYRPPPVVMRKNNNDCHRTHVRRGLCSNILSQKRKRLLRWLNNKLIRGGYSIINKNVRSNTNYYHYSGSDFN